MKKLFLLLTLLGMVAVGCSKDDTDKGNDNKTEQPNENEGGNENDDDEKPVFEIDAEGSYTIPAQGAEIKVTITTNLEYRVEVSEDAKAWLSIGDTRAVRTETLVFTASKNESDRERTATITIFNKDDEKVFEFRLTQKFNNKEDIPGNIFFGIDKESVTISPDGGSVDVIVYSNYKWEISGVSDWCTPSVKKGDANEDGQKVTFSADVAYDDREATFWFRCADKQIKFVVSQKLKETIIPDANNTFNIPAEGGIAVISYQTSVDCEVIIPEEAQDWITIAPATRGLVRENINLDIAENTTYSSRSAVIKVVAKDNAALVVEYTINQVQNDAILVDENNTFTVPSEGGNIEIAYQTNVDCDVIIPEEAQDWITIAPATRGLVSENINLDIAENTTYSARTAVVKVVAKDNAELVVEYTINQEQNDAILADENNTFTVPCAGGEVAINYQTNIDCDVIIPEEAQSWITIEPTTRGLISENITLNIAENTTYSARTAVVKVVAKDNAEIFVEYTINQEQNDAVLANGNTEFTIDGRKQQITIEHKANVDCDVIIPEEAQDWITIAPATRGLSTYSTTLNIAENNSVEERSCVIKVTSQGDNELFAEYTIVQNPIRSIYYTSSDGKIVTPYDSSAFGATIVSNTYIDGVGVIEFNAPITTIGNSAFYECSSLTSVTIPDSVTTIGVAAFMICDSLQEFKSKFASEDGRCLIIDGVLNSFAIGCGATEYTIPDSVTTIGAGAFACCSSLTSVTIPNSVTTIREYAFAYCSSLTSVTIPNSVTTIGYWAFSGCSSLTSVTIGDSVTTIGENAFNSCSSLTSVTIGDSVTTIGNSAFAFCSSLTSVYISDISAWCNISFGNSYSNPLCYADNLYLNNELVTDLIIPDSVTTIGHYAFAGCSSLTSVYCKATTPPVGGSEMFYGNATGRKIYVPMESVEAYKSASYWKNYANSIEGYNF